MSVRVDLLVSITMNLAYQDDAKVGKRQGKRLASVQAEVIGKLCYDYAHSPSMLAFCMPSSNHRRWHSWGHPVERYEKAKSMSAPSHY